LVATTLIEMVLEEALKFSTIGLDELIERVPALVHYKKITKFEPSKVIVGLLFSEGETFNPTIARVDLSIKFPNAS